MEHKEEKILKLLHVKSTSNMPVVAITVIVAVSLYVGLPLEQPVRAGLVIFITAALLWLSEAIALTLTALLIPVLAVLLQVMPVKQAFSDFANPIIFLFLGGFALASALAKQGLDKALGTFVLNMAGTSPVRAVYLLFVVTACLSMWISNTATAAMMLPVALGVASRFNDPHQRTQLFLLLGTAYSASIGGIATLVGSPPNAIAASSQHISFSEWLLFGVPVALLLMPLMIMWLHILLKPPFTLAATTHDATTPLTQHDTINPLHRRLTLGIFLFVVCGWIFSGPLSAALGIRQDLDAWVAIAGIILLGATGVIRWDDIEEKTNWGILLLFGGGMTLSSVLDQSGASTYIAEHLKLALENAPAWLALLLITAFVVFLTELVSNTASAALLIPLFVPVSLYFGVSPKVVAVLIAVSASCAFMLPVATPPNAIVFGTGAVPQRVMMRCGVALNLSCILVIAILSLLESL